MAITMASHHMLQPGHQKVLKWTLLILAYLAIGMAYVWLTLRGIPL